MLQLDPETLTKILAIYAAIVSTYAAFLTTVQVGIALNRWSVERQSLIKVDVSYAYVGHLGVAMSPSVVIECANVGVRRTTITSWGIPAGRKKYLMDIYAECHPSLPTVLEPGDTLKIIVDKDKLEVEQRTHWPYHKTWVKDAAGKRYYFRAPIKHRVKGSWKRIAS